MPDELSELQENAERGRENPSLAPISVTMAILAVCVAVVSLLGHRAHTEEIVSQARASDQWSYYQAKNIRRKPSAIRKSKQKLRSRPRISRRSPLSANAKRIVLTSVKCFLKSLW